MTFDYWVELPALTSLPGQGEFPSSSEEAAWNLASGFVDSCTEWSVRGDEQRIEIRNRYIEEASSKTLSLPAGLSSLRGPDFNSTCRTWPPSWLAIEVQFELLTPWYSKDDRVFHVMDNPVRKDRVFGVPFMAASSWKGLLRWACRMQAGLREYLRKSDGKLEGWRDPDWILHLFGNEKGEEKNFHQGAMVFYPTWFDKIGFEVINPHSRARRAGTQPVYYEVVPPGAKGTLYLLYAPWAGMKPSADPKRFLPRLTEAIENLLTRYGISAKRTVGWGTANISVWKAYRKGQDPAQADTREKLWNAIANWFQERTP